MLHGPGHARAHEPRAGSMAGGDCPDSCHNPPQAGRTRRLLHPSATSANRTNAPTPPVIPIASLLE
jgi:hypothetical protein